MARILNRPTRHPRCKMQEATSKKQDANNRRRQLWFRHEFLHFECLNLASHSPREPIPFEPIRYEPSSLRFTRMLEQPALRSAATSIRAHLRSEDGPPIPNDADSQKRWGICLCSESWIGVSYSNDSERKSEHDQSCLDVWISFGVADGGLREQAEGEAVSLGRRNGTRRGGRIETEENRDALGNRANRFRDEKLGHATKEGVL